MQISGWSRAEAPGLTSVCPWVDRDPEEGQRPENPRGGRTKTGLSSQRGKRGAGQQDSTL